MDSLFVQCCFIWKFDYWYRVIIENPCVLTCKCLVKLAMSDLLGLHFQLVAMATNEMELTGWHCARMRGISRMSRNTFDDRVSTGDRIAISSRYYKRYSSCCLTKQLRV